MIPVGPILVILGGLGEIVGGQRFREFFVWAYPEQFHRSTEWLKVKVGRVAIVLGVVLLAAGLVAGALN